MRPCPDVHDYAEDEWGSVTQLPAVHTHTHAHIKKNTDLETQSSGKTDCSSCHNLECKPEPTLNAVTYAVSPIFAADAPLTLSMFKCQLSLSFG